MSRYKWNQLHTNKYNFQSLSAVAQDFEQGDLLYGLVGPRRPYVNEIRSRRRDCKEPIFVDYVTTKILSFPDFTGYPTYRSYKGKNKYAANFATFLESHAKYNPNQSGGAEAEAYFTRKRRLCKGGILFTIKSGKKVHFILDKLDMRSVVEKSAEDDTPDNFPGPKHRAYTGSELRSIYRLRHNKEAMKNLSFWQNGTRVPPPWEQDPQLWTRYQPRNQATAAVPKESLCKNTWHRIRSSLTHKD